MLKVILYIYEGPGQSGLQKTWSKKINKTKQQINGKLA